MVVSENYSPSTILVRFRFDVLSVIPANFDFLMNDGLRPKVDALFRCNLHEKIALKQSFLPSNNF